MNKLLGILILALIYGCSEQTEAFSKILPLQKINERVAKENSAKLTVEVNNLQPDQLNITIESEFTDLLFPGKIIHDYYHEVNNSSLSYSTFCVLDKAGNELECLSVKELSLASFKIFHSKTMVKRLVDKNFPRVYDQLDTTMTSQMTLDEFSDLIGPFNLTNMEFSGFMNEDGYQAMGYSNSESRILFTYKSDSEDNLIYGINIE